MPGVAGSEDQRVGGIVMAMIWSLFVYAGRLEVQEESMGG